MPKPGISLLSLLLVLSLLFIDLPRTIFAETSPVYSAFEEDITPPVVISTYPTNNLSNIPLNTAISATFTESIDAATINMETFLLMNGSNIINGTVSYNDTDKIATFTLSNDLEDNYLDYGAGYTATVTTGVADLAGNHLPDNYSWSFTSKESNVMLSIGSPSEILEGSFLEISINISGADNVTAYDLMLDFDESILQVTGVTNGLIDNKTIPNYTYIPVDNGTIRLVGFNPDNEAASGEGYLARVNFRVAGTAGQISSLILSGITVFDIYGLSMPLTKSDGEITVIAPVPIPKISSIFPDTGKQGKPSLPVQIIGDNLTEITALVFSGTGVTATNFSAVSATRINANISVDNTAIPGNRDVTITAPGGTDTLQNGFTVTDGQPPSVLSTSPVNNEVDIAINTSITATFSEFMQSSSIIPINFILFKEGNPITGTVNYSNDNKTAVFTPPFNLEYSVSYTVTLTPGIIDLAGNSLEDNFTWSFITQQMPDTLPPAVISIYPSNGLIDVPFNIAVTASFSEDINISTINTSTFKLIKLADQTSIEGIVYFSNGTILFVPQTDLEALTEYTPIITTGVTDLAGNPLEDNFTWSFTTKKLPDTLPPAVISTYPSSGMTGVPFNIAVTAGFSEDIDNSTINTSTFQLIRPADQTPIQGIVFFANGAALFVPQVDLEELTEYTAVLTTGVTDMAGNPLEDNYTWSFTTKKMPDTLPPIIISTDPGNEETEVPTGSLIKAVFSEPLLNTSINTSSFILMNDDVPVSGIVTYDDDSRTASFAPSSNLDYASRYTATITTDAADMAGNVLSDNYTWYFVTDSTTQTIVSSSKNPSTFREEVTFTASVHAGVSSDIHPEGKVTFTDGINFIGTGQTNASGQAIYTSSILTVGSHIISAQYKGDSRFSASSSPVLVQIVNRASSTTDIMSSINPSIYGLPVTFTAEVHPVLPATDIPTGNVTFMDGFMELGTSSLDEQGKASLISSDLTEGIHSISAVYSGDANYSSSASVVLTHQIDSVLYIYTNSLPDGDQKAFYSQKLTVLNGEPPYTWSIVKNKGESLPTGLKLNSTTGIISGKPTRSGTYNFTLRVADNTEAWTQDNYTIDINPAVTLSAKKLPTGEVNVVYPEWVPEASGGDGVFAWSISKGDLPTGLNLDNSTGTIYGIPDMFGTFLVTLKVIDGKGGSASKTLSLKILKALRINTLTLPSSEIGITYKSTPLKAEGGTRKYTWSILEGDNALPPGLSLVRGIIKGKPADNSSSKYSFTVQVSDNITEVAQALSIIINDPLEFTIDPEISSDRYNPEIVTLGNDCNYTLNPTGGSGIYKFRMSGSLPKGLKLITEETEGSTVYSISGNLIKTGSYRFTLKLTDSLKGSKTQTFYLKVVNPE